MNINAGPYVIRSWQRGDEAALTASINNPHITSTLAARQPRTYTEEHARAWIDLCALEADPVNFAIADDTGVIGSIGLTLQRGARRRSAEVGFWVAEDHWGMGIATQVLQAFSDYAFAQFDLLRLHAYVFDGNAASIRVLEKAGYVYEGTLTASITKDDRVIDELVYALVRRS
jgi:[ribosomal protein S5]-alanine N-acetyltransferase